MSIFITFIIIVVVVIVLCIVSKCFENSAMARVRRVQEHIDSDMLDFDISLTNAPPST